MGQFMVSKVEASFRNDNQRINIELMDISLSPMMAMPFKMAMSITVDSSDAIQRPLELKGHKGIEKLNFNSQNGEIILMIKDRFLLTIKGRGMDDLKPMRTAAEAVNVNCIAKLAP